METLITRRETLVKLAVTFGGAVAVLNCSPSEQSSPVSLAEKVLPLDEAIRRIRVIEKDLGIKPLTFDEARSYLPLLGDFFIGELNGLGVGTRLTPKELRDQTFIIRAGFSSPKEAEIEYKRSHSGKDADAFRSPPIKMLMQDYPGYNITADFARFLIRRLREGVLGIQHETFGVFLILDKINTAQNQFEGFGKQAVSILPFPVANLRSIYLHELGHLDAKSKGQKVPEDLGRAYTKVDNTKVPLKETFMDNFAIDLMYADNVGDSNMRSERGLHEFALDYFTSGLSVAIGLPYTLAYHTKYGPSDMESFRAVLANAKISNIEAYKMYRQTQLREFLIKVAQGAKGIEFRNEQEMLDFSVKHFLFKSHEPIKWENLAPFYPGL